MPTLTVQQIAEHIAGRVVGAADVAVTGVNQLDGAVAGELTFIGGEKFASKWATSAASAALVNEELIDAVGEPGDGRALIVVNNADLAMAKALALFAPPAPGAGLIEPAGGEPAVHATAIVEPGAILGRNVRIGPGAFIADGVKLGDRTTVHANVTILDGSTLGEDCTLWPGVVIRERCTLGDRCIIHPNVTIGADGFGYRPDPATGGLAKIPQIGTVEIGDDVELGAGTCVDRGKFAATVIGDGCKIDNLCHIAHNCRLGKCVVMAGQVGLAGSVTIGDGVMFGGQAGVADHVTIGAGATIAAHAGIHEDVPPGEFRIGAPGRDRKQFVREWAFAKKLPELMKQWRKENRGERDDS